MLWAALVAWLALGGRVLAQPAGDYQLGGGDSIRVSVFLSPELNTEARISESGQVTFPLIGRVKVGGLTLPQAETLVADRLKQGGFVQNAQVGIAVLQYRSQQVSMLGNVNRPGRYAIEARGMRLTDILAAAGGIAAGGADTLIVTRRDAEGRAQRIEVDLPGIYLDGKAEQDVVMQGGDSVYVPNRPVFYIYGQVQRPGLYPIERGMTVGQAIAAGGSFTTRSKESGVRLLRRDAQGRLVTRTAGLDEAVQADDQIYVRESLF